MIIQEVKHKTKKRFSTVDVSNLDIQGYGADNAYPQDMRLLVASSGTAINCRDRYAKFIRGAGFADEVFYKSIINAKEQTTDNILRAVSEDMADFRGFALHVNYNVLGEITSVAHVPFDHCRLGLEDDNGYVSKIAVHPDWTVSSGKKRIKKPSKDTIDYIDVFNPNKGVVLAQMDAAGGVNQYNGQILYVTATGQMEYPTAKYDGVITDISTDEGLSNIRYRNTRNNFLPAGMYVFKEGTQVDDEDEEESGFDPEKLKTFQGDSEACKIIGVRLDREEEFPQFVEFPTKNFDKEYTVTSDAVEKKIYAAFSQEVFYRLSTGALGFSTDIVTDAFNFYNVETTDERILVEEAFKKVFQHFYIQVNPSSNYAIKPLTYAVGSI